MKNEIKYVHTNIVARNWKALAQFYIDVFGCEPLYPERDLSGEWIDQMTQIPEVRIQGIHLALPGTHGLTLEIFEYNQANDRETLPHINHYGFGHIAFHVSDVEAMLKKIITCGGASYGELIEKEIAGVGVLKAVYARDPEGNIIEIQNWKKAD